MKRVEQYLQLETTSKWDVMKFFASSDIDIGRQDGGAALKEGGGGMEVVF